MPEDNEQPEEIRLSDVVVTEEAERALVVPESGGKSIIEAEETSVNKTDLQAAMNALLPKFPTTRLNNILQPAMVSRIFPDNFIDKHFLITAALIEECDPESDVDVVGIISMVQDALSIGYEGRGRVDILEVAGVAHEEEMEKLSKELGLFK